MKFKDFYKDYLLPALSKLGGWLVKHIGFTLFFISTGGFIYEAVSYNHLHDVYVRAGITAKSDLDKLNSTIVGLANDLTTARSNIEAGLATITEQQQTISKLQGTIGQLQKILDGLASTGDQLDAGEQQLEGLIAKAIGLEHRVVAESQSLGKSSR